MATTKQIVKLDLDGNIVRVFDSISEAADDANCTRTTIHSKAHAIRPEGQIYNGFRYKYTGKHIQKATASSKRAVVKIDQTGKVLESYESILAAAKANINDGFQHEMVKKRCEHNVKREWRCGYTFRFADDPDYLAPCKAGIHADRSKKVKLIDKAGNIVTYYPSIYSASVAMHTNAAAVSRACMKESPDYIYKGLYAPRFADAV